MEDYVMVFFILTALIGFIGLCGNIIVIIVYIFDKKLRSFTNYFFVNLSIADILIVLLCLPVSLMDMINDNVWVLGEFICNFEIFIESVFLCVSALTLIGISVARFFATQQPIHINQINKMDNKRSTLGIILILWVISLILSSPMIHFASFNIEKRNLSGNQSGSEDIPYCFIERSTNASKTYVSIFTSFILFAPTLILTCVYVHIIHKLKTINRRMSYNRYNGSSDTNNNGSSTFFLSSSYLKTPPNYEHESQALAPNKQQQLVVASVSSAENNSNFVSQNNVYSMRILMYEETLRRAVCHRKQQQGSFCTKNLIKKRKQTITLCLIAMAFCFCQIPIKLFQLFNTFYVWHSDHDFKTLNIVYHTTKLIYFFHSMSNPIIYNLMSSKFSRSYRKVLLCKSLSGYSLPNNQKINVCFNKLNKNNRPNSFYDFRNNQNEGIVLNKTSFRSPLQQQQQPVNKSSNIYD